MAYRVKPGGILKWTHGFGAVPSSSVQAALASASASYGVPLSLLTSVAKAESGFDPSAVSPKGAQGLMQIMPGTGGSLGLSNPFDPGQSANAGAKYLSQLYAQYGDWQTALIAYNEGPGNLQKQGVYPSSQAYADGILADAGLSAGSDGGPGPIYDFGAAGPSDGSLSGAAWAGIAAVGAALVWWAAG